MTRLRRAVRGATTLLAALVAAAALSGCTVRFSTSGAGTQRFHHPDYQITFDYPNTLRETDDVRFDVTAGGRSTRDKAVALYLDNDNMIVVERATLRGSITKDNLAEAQREVEELVPQLGTLSEPGKQVERAGLPGLEYRLTLRSGKPSHILFLFDGTVYYRVVCESTDQRRQQITEACDMVHRTLAHT
ncbi:hypothetical protein [Pseudonocardia acaciae]|uniref:hypothetical protein n=1 Tax=Pseudonocardia acaciae TaxID=551276 RepID=UPI00048AC862|nr:hypothetical protein [Pseudonocardia acaciae]